MTHHATLALLLLLSATPVRVQAQDTLVPSRDIGLVRSPPLTPATAELAGIWELRLSTPDRRLAADIRLVHDSLFACPLALMIRPGIDSGCLRGELPLEWIYVLGYAAGQWLHVVRVRDSVWAIVPGDGIISGIARTGDLFLAGVVRGKSVAGVWAQTRIPDSLHGGFTLRRTSSRP